MNVFRPQVRVCRHCARCMMMAAVTVVAGEDRKEQQQMVLLEELTAAAKAATPDCDALCIVGFRVVPAEGRPKPMVRFKIHKCRVEGP